MPTRTVGCGGTAEVLVQAERDKASRKLREAVRDLNKAHNTGIFLPNPKNSQSSRFDKEYRRCSQICERLAYLVVKNDGTLQRVRASFVNEVKAETQKWAAVPTSLDTLKAESAGEKLRLQEVLLELLQRCVPANLLPPTTTTANSQLLLDSIPSPSSRSSESHTPHRRPGSELGVPTDAEMDIDVETPSKPRCKRPSDGELSPSECASKKRKGKTGNPSRPSPVPGPKAVSALDQVPRRRRHQTAGSSSDSSFKTPKTNPTPTQVAPDLMSDVNFGDDERDVGAHKLKPKPTPLLSQGFEAQRFEFQRPTVAASQSHTPLLRFGLDDSTVPERYFQCSAAVSSSQKMAVRPRLSAVSTGSTDYYSIEEIVISDDDDDDDNDEPVAIAPPRDSNVTPKPTQWAVAPPPPKPTTNTTKASFAAPPVPSTPSTRARTIPAKNIATPSRAPVTPSRPVATPAASARTPVTPSSRQIATPSAQTPVATIRKRLTGIWPSFPEWLHEAPMAVAWEMMRIGVHCKVDLSTLDGMQYNKEWATPRGIEKMWEDLRAYDKEHPLITNDDSLVALRFKTFPAKPADDIFAAALTDGFEFAGNTVVMVASLDYSPKSWGPLYLLDMKPLKFEKGCRLTRRFGPDRFLEVLIASPTGYGTAHAKIDGAAEAIIDWLTLKPHPLAGRKWRAFYTKSAGFRDPTKTDDTLLPASQMAKKIGTERVHLFAETGYGFKRAPSQDQDADFVVPVDETSASRTDFMASQMLDWLLDFKNNTDQPFLKLFSRISLGLTKTTPTVTFLPDHLVPEGESKQLLHQVEDILSPTGQVMNDGCGRMSLGTARLIRDYLGLQEIPSAVQGRIGSAKGMWIRDVDDPGQDLDNIWIETFPSQRKWVCDFEDPLQRTLEIKDVSRELSSANLNLQFLPVLEDRAVDKKKMRKTLGDRLRRELMRVFEAQDNAFSSPVHFKQWLAHFSTRKRRANIGYVPMLGGIPESKEELMHMMLDGGFVPKDSLYMVETALKLQQQLCEDLRTKMKISVGCSTYAYMCPDFTRTVPEGEAHLAFSNKFHAEDQDAFFTLLTKCDLLVARAPAHHPSDVQRVKAVFRHDLHCVQNVILFSIKGNVPLADKLSGGDYDGDLAWVCWDQEIVENFQNAEVPVQPDLSEHLVKDKRRFVDLIPAPADKETSKLDNVLFYSEPNTHGAARGPAALTTATYEMVNKSFQFAMLPDYLGICTNYKEKICYHRGNVNDEVALLLSTLVGQLVDAAKQGTKFTDATWKTLRTQLGPMQLPDPAYKTENRTFNVPVEQMHIIDYLKFIVAIPAIKSHLNALQIKLNPSASPRKGLSPSSLNEPKRTHYDADLTKLCNNFDDLGKTSSTFQNIHLRLKEALGELFEAWQRSARNPMSNDTSSSSANRVLRIYPQYQAITLQSLDCKTAPNIAFLLSGGPGTTTNSQPFLLSGESYLSDPSEYSQFALLKASTLFKHYYQRHPPYVWHMAGRQLCVLKALAVTNGGGSGYLTTVVPLMYAGMGTDQKFVRQYLARREVDSRRYIEGMEGEKEASVYDGY